MAAGHGVLGRSLGTLFRCSERAWSQDHVREPDRAAAVTRVRVDGGERGAGSGIPEQPQFRDGWRKAAPGRYRVSSPSSGFSACWKIKPLGQKNISRSNLEVSEADICPRLHNV